MMILSTGSLGFGDDNDGDGVGGGDDGAGGGGMGGDGGTYGFGDEDDDDIPGFTTGAPHSAQKFFPGLISDPHDSQMGILPPWHDYHCLLVSFF